MAKFDLQQLATSYNVYNDDKTQVKTVSVVEYGMLLEIILLHDEEAEVSGGELIDLFTGFVESPWHISWYAARIEQFNLQKAVTQCIREKNEIVVTQILPSEDFDDKYNKLSRST